MRARVSSPRLVSCVEVAESACGHDSWRSRLRSWKRSSGDADERRLAADLVQRGERVEAVEGRVFEPLRRDRAGELLEAEHEVAPLGALLRRTYASGLRSSSSEAMKSKTDASCAGLRRLAARTAALMLSRSSGLTESCVRRM